MPAAVNTSGSQTAVISTEHTLATVTAAGTYIGVVDLNALANGDTVIIRIYAKVAASGDTARVVYSGSYSHVQEQKIAIAPPLLTPISFAVTLQQVAGTGRAFPWAVWSV